MVWTAFPNIQTGDDITDEYWDDNLKGNYEHLLAMLSLLPDATIFDFTGDDGVLVGDSSGDPETLQVTNGRLISADGGSIVLLTGTEGQIVVWQSNKAQFIEPESLFNLTHLLIY